MDGFFILLLLLFILFFRASFITFYDTFVVLINKENGFPKVKDLISFLPLSFLAMHNERNWSLVNFLLSKEEQWDVA